MLRAFDDGRLFGDSFGSGPATVLALPGWMRTRSDFQAVLAGAPSVALDLPGFGGAVPEPPEAWGAADYAVAVAPVLADMADEVVVVGHSFGGRVAVHLAASHRDRVVGLVLTGVPLLKRSDRPPTRAPLPFRVARALHRRGVVSDARMERMKRAHGSADYRAASGVMRDVLVRVVNETYEAQLAAISAPVELVWGADDDAAPVQVAERAAALLARSNLTVVPGVGHFLPVRRPDVLREAIERVAP